MPLTRAMPDLLAAQRGHLFLWAPVFLGLGIGGYFALPAEPLAVHWLMLGTMVLGAGGLAWRGPPGAAPFFVALALVAAGALLAGARTHLVAAPVLEFRFYGPIEGTVAQIDRSISDVPRLTLENVWMAGLSPARTPARVRIALHGTLPEPLPPPGARVMTTGHLSPPSGPAEPGGYDYRLNAWFAAIGAVGYTRNPVVLAAPDGPAGARLWLAERRLAIAAGLRARMPGEAGAFAAAILVGDRAHIPRDTLQDLRDSNLAHLLAISGLHMGLLTGLAYAGLRGGLALVPVLALRLPVRRIAAVGAIAAGAVYLALSGASVATQRAFVMVCVVFVAVLLDRRALTLRAVALAALIVLLVRPESLLGPGFQMSFAATAALVAAFAALRDLPYRAPAFLKGPLALVISSAVAGAATAPYGAAHFNQIAPYGLLANLLGVPAMGLVVMPGALVAGVLAPFGLEGLGLWPMARGIEWIVAVAGWVAGLEGATHGAVAPGRWVLPVFTLGALFVLLWQGRARWLGLAPVLLAFWLWAGAGDARPTLLIAQSGGLMGLAGPEGRALSRPRGDGFVGMSWLENDGDRAGQPEAAARPGFQALGEGVLMAEVAGLRVAQLRGRGWRARLAETCALADMVVLPYEAPPDAPKGCDLRDMRALGQSGALAISAGGQGAEIRAARARDGARPWTGGDRGW